MGVNQLAEFREAVGTEGAVCVRGGATRWDLGGDPAGAHEVRAPSGVEEFLPAEMTVAAGAGTTLAELTEALGASGQEVALDGPPGATVGGTLVVGRSSLRRGRIGLIADTLLQADCVGADGALFTAGGPTVKNVTGYDVCRLLVGSLGTLALLGRVILRTRPMPEASLWMAGELAPGRVADVAYRPATVLWDGEWTTVRLEGHPGDLRDERDRLAALGLGEVDEPELGPCMSRWAGEIPSGAVLDVLGGVVYGDRPETLPVTKPGVLALAGRMRDEFDPGRRLNPGRDPYRVAA